MIPNFKVGDLVRYYPSEEIEVGDGGKALITSEDSFQGIITGFVDVETGQRLNGDFSTHDKVIAASVLSPRGSDIVLIHDLEMVSAAHS